MRFEPETFDVTFVELTSDAADSDEWLRAPDDGRVVLVQVAQDRKSENNLNCFIKQNRTCGSS